MTNLHKVVLIGRANTGKSTLFNRLIEQKKSLVSDIAGTTRDRLYADLEWNHARFTLIDTGGVDSVHQAEFKDDIIKQTKTALLGADLVVFLVDRQTGLMPQDKEVARLIRSSGKKTIVAVNKADNSNQKKNISEFYAFGFQEVLAVSALNGSGTGDLLDSIVMQLKNLPKKKIKISEDGSILKLAIIGKPNVGKSSLVNSILGEERVIVSPAPYTTRDANEINWDYDGQKYILIDTAGLRKHSKIGERLEKMSASSSEKAIEKADVVMLVTDVSLPLTNQDQRLGDMIIDKKASIIIVANKWDLIPDKDEKTINKYIAYYYRFFPFLSFAPIVFTSAVTGKRVNEILKLAKETYKERFKTINEKCLEKFLNHIIKKHPPAKGKGVKKPRLLGLKQIDTNPPVFELVKDYQSDLHASYISFLENQLREKFDFLGAPLKIKMRKLGK